MLTTLISLLCVSMGNTSSSQPQAEDEETQPILSAASAGIQSGEDSGYGGAQHFVRSSSSPALHHPASEQNGSLRSTRSSVKLKTDMRREGSFQRMPYVYRPLPTTGQEGGEGVGTRGGGGDTGDHHLREDDRRRGILRRLHYFHRLDRRPDSILAMPDHIVPEDFWVKILGPVENKHSSIVTIFSLWNTMMGTSLLSMPWAIQQAGFIGGISLLILMALIMAYTSYLVLKSVRWVAGKKFSEFSDVCGHFLGKYANGLAVFSSLVTLLGGMIVYWILLTNFLYHIVVFIYNQIHPISSDGGAGYSSADHYMGSFQLYGNSSNAYPDVVCSGGDNDTQGGNSTSSVFEKVWREDLSVPLLLSLLLIWLVNFKSATIFTKLNSLGVVSVVYLLVFTCVKAAHWGVHLELGTSTAPHPDQPFYSPDFKMTFPALTGICALAYFVQNCVLAITRNNEHQENNVRDLGIAYFLVAFCYTFVGAIIYVCFPLAKDCIEDNFLNNFAPDDIMAFIAHILLFFQMTCVFPLLTFILRSQLFLCIFGTDWPGFKRVLGLSVLLFGICIIFAIFLPHIGRIIGFVGAFCGLAYAIALPCCVYIQAQRLNGTLTKPSLIFHCLLIALGIANFVAQFLILGKTS